jgi:hypothetical protein
MNVILEHLFLHRPIQEANAEALRNLVKSGPISPKRVCAMPVRIPGIWVRSTPKACFNSARKTPSLDSVLVGGEAVPRSLVDAEVSWGGGTVLRHGESRGHNPQSASDNCDKPSGTVAT